MERVSAYAEGVRHERAMSESAAHGESTWTRKRTTAEGLMGRFWTFYSKVAQAYGVCNLRERIAPLRRLSGSLSALILRELGRGSRGSWRGSRGSWILLTPATPGPGGQWAARRGADATRSRRSAQTRKPAECRTGTGAVATSTAARSRGAAAAAGGKAHPLRAKDWAGAEDHGARSAP